MVFEKKGDSKKWSKKAICHLAIWQNLCFGQFYHSSIEFLEISQLLAKVKGDTLFIIFVSFSHHLNLNEQEKIKIKKSAKQAQSIEPKIAEQDTS